MKSCRLIFLLFCFVGFTSVLLYAASEVVVNAPRSRKVFQRRHGQAPVSLAGTLSGIAVVDSAQARYVLTDDPTQAGDWQSISHTNTTFSGSIVVPQGGWYTIEVKAVAGLQSWIGTVEKIGVGEVFVTAGQSNAANGGSTPLMPSNDTVSAWSDHSGWVHAADPQPVSLPIQDYASAGSPWSRLGDILVDELNVPVGFMMVAQGGTAVFWWLPGVTYSNFGQSGILYDRFPAVLNEAGPNGIRAVLWHQGESDALGVTPTATYESQLTTVINQMRTDVGWQVPWGVAIASWVPDDYQYGNPSEASREAIRQAQRNVIATVADVFEGPYTDSLIGPTYRTSDNVHFNNTGLLEHARLWKEKIIPFINADDGPVCPIDFPDLTNDDCVVTLSDVVLLVGNWLECGWDVAARCDD